MVYMGNERCSQYNSYLANFMIVFSLVSAVQMLGSSEINYSMFINEVVENMVCMMNGK
jgi:hypothetical protein